MTRLLEAAQLAAQIMRDRGEDSEAEKLEAEVEELRIRNAELRELAQQCRPIVFRTQPNDALTKRLTRMIDLAEAEDEA